MSLDADACREFVRAVAAMPRADLPCGKCRWCLLGTPDLCEVDIDDLVNMLNSIIRWANKIVLTPTTPQQQNLHNVQREGTSCQTCVSTPRKSSKASTCSKRWRRGSNA